jgi:outer membrane protein assembly factor BamD
MGLPIPTPTPEQAAASAALENSRGQYTLSKRATVLFLRQADTVPAATVGEPPLEDAKATTAPMVVKQAITDFNTSMNPGASAPQAAAPTPASDGSVSGAGTSVDQPAASVPLTFQDVPSSTAGVSSGSAVTSVPAGSGPSGGSSMGIEIVQPSSESPTPGSTPTSPPPFPGSASAGATPGQPAQTGDGNGGLKAVGPSAAVPLAPIEKAATAPDAINDVTPGSQPASQTAATGGKKKPKPAFDKADESSSKHKKKKGVAKLNPF